VKLAVWLTLNKLGYSAFGRRIGVSGKRVRRWCLAPGHVEHRTPRPAMIPRIVEETAGAVQPNDFYDMPAPAVTVGRDSREDAA